METISNINNKKRIVYGEGPRDAKVMIVGEAPGAREDRVGKPFVGKAGNLLDANLSKAGIIRSQCYITNVIKERPPNNNVKKFINIKKNEVTEEYEKYEEYLYDEIRDVNPNIIVAAGATPLWALARKRGITKWRGSVIESEVLHPDTLQPIKMLPIIHPAASFHQYIWRHYISYDLKKVKGEQDSPDIERKDRNYIIGPSYHRCLEYIAECKKHPRVAFDIEIGYGEVSCISLSYKETEAISIPFLRGSKEYFSPDQAYEIWKGIGEILEDPEIESLGQNVTFDSTFLFRRYGIKSRNLQDTMIAQAINFPDFKKDLGFITSVYTDIPYYKDEGKAHFNKGQRTGNEAFWVYNAKDSIVLMEAFPKQLQELKEMDNLETYDHQRRLIEPLLYMTELGIRMDVNYLDNLSEHHGKKLEELQEQINEEVGYEINPRSPKQLKEYFYGPKSEGGLGIKAYTNNGRPTTDEGALIRLGRGTKNRAPVRAADLVLEHRSLAKMKGTYLDIELDDDNRVRSSMNPVGTRTGRLSSSKTIFGTGGNMQNMPPVMKKSMKPDKGHIAYEIDLGQAENRVVAYIAPEPKMIEAFETGIDIHSRTASYIFDMPEDEIAGMKEEGVMCESIGKGDHTHRFWGKKANHAFNYRQGHKSFAYQVEIPEHEGKLIRGKYFTAYPGVEKYHRWVEQDLKQGRVLTNLFGRRYLFLDRWNWHMINEACAFIPQSTVGDIINRWGLLEVYYDQEKYPHVKLLNQIHDSIVFQMPINVGLEEHARSIRRMSDSMSRTLEFHNREFSIPCDLTIYTDNMKEGPEVENVDQMSIEDITKAIEEEHNKDAADIQA